MHFYTCIHVYIFAGICWHIMELKMHVYIFSYSKSLKINYCGVLILKIIHIYICGTTCRRPFYPDITIHEKRYKS